MVLILCTVCEKSVSSDAQSCPNCGHPIAKRHTENLSPRIVLQTKTSPFANIFLILFILIGIFVLIAAITKPNESVLRNSLSAKYGLVYGIGTIGEKIGIVDIKYNDYIVFSTLSMRLASGPEQNVAFGFLGQKLIQDVPLSLENERVSQPKTNDVPANIVSEPRQNSPIANVSLSTPPGETHTLIPANIANTNSVRSEEEMLNELQISRQILLSTEIPAKVRETFSKRHPFSKIEQCSEPNIQILNQSSFGEDIIATYSCSMRGDIMGKNIFLVTVMVRGTIAFQNGMFIREIVDSTVTTDQPAN